MNFHIREQKATKKLRELRVHNPELGRLIRECLEHEENGVRLTAQQILFILRCERLARSDKKIALIGNGGTSYGGEKIAEVYLDGLHRLNEDKKNILSLFLHRGYLGI